MKNKEKAIRTHPTSMKQPLDNRPVTIAPNASAKVEFLRQTRLFAEVANNQLEEIAADMRTRCYKTRDTIFMEGDPGNTLYLVKSGQVRIFVNGMDGSETSVILVGRKGQIFGELAIIDGLPRSATALAMLDTVLYVMDRDNFRRHMTTSPQLTLNFMQALSGKLRYNTQQVTSLASMDIARRLARKILELGQDFGVTDEQGVKIDWLLNQTDLASLVGATRERTNKVLRVFREQGLIMIEGGYMTILDAEGLHARVVQ